MTALHSAAGFGREAIAKFLLAKGAKFNKLDADGQTPAAVAASFGHARLADVFALAETEDGMEQIKLDGLPGYQEEKARRTMAEKAKKDATAQRRSEVEREEARQRREAQFSSQMEAHRQSVRERRQSVGA